VDFSAASAATYSTLVVNRGLPANFAKQPRSDQVGGVTLKPRTRRIKERLKTGAGFSTGSEGVLHEARRLLTH
jgi:hypothetical protein